MKKRKVCVITSSRADYGILRPLLFAIKKDADLILQLVATGAHLSSYFGMTYKEIEKDGFSINEKINISLISDTPESISKSMGLAMPKFSKVYKKLKPDIVVVLGDRFEIFSAVACAFVNKIPLAHISGGEVTEGALDDSFRHCITKMSHLHFVSTEIYRKRVIQLGEEPKRVFNVGAINLDNIKAPWFLSKESLERMLKFKFNKHNLLVTFHPVTLEQNTSKRQFRSLLNVLDELRDTHIIFTKANADPDGRIINTMIDDCASRNLHKSSAFTSMGQLQYLSTMQFVDAIVGNSSSGIIEAPSFKIATVNIGDRQKGRIKVKSIIDCKPTEKDIKRAIKKIYSKKFQESLKTTVNSYGDGHTAKRIKRILKNYNLTDIAKKPFYDIDVK